MVGFIFRGKKQILDSLEIEKILNLGGGFYKG